MYSNEQIESAVAAGAITAEDADAIHSHIAEMRRAPIADEEQFRLVSSFNDIFVAIAGALALFGIIVITGKQDFYLACITVAAAAWGLAEFFTRKRRMALPSILFLLAFHFGIFLLALSFVKIGHANLGDIYSGRASELDAFGKDRASVSAAISHMRISVIVALLVTAAANVGHWFRFHVPLSIANATGCVGFAIFALITAAFPENMPWESWGPRLTWMLLAMGLSVFTFAMWWDMKDPTRTSGKADVAFWLHLLASPMIVHSIFVLIAFNVGIKEDKALMLALVAVALYLTFAVIALIVDRRAILVSALAYFLTAIGYLLYKVGGLEVNSALAAVMIGSALLLLSAFWQKMRKLILPALPDNIRVKLPDPDRGLKGGAAHV